MPIGLIEVKDLGEPIGEVRVIEEKDNLDKTIKLSRYWGPDFDDIILTARHRLSKKTTVEFDVWKFPYRTYSYFMTIAIMGNPSLIDETIFFQGNSNHLNTLLQRAAKATLYNFEFRPFPDE